MNNDFGNIMKAASHIKSTQLDQDKRKFDSLPEYSKTGLYCGEMFVNVRKQSFELKKLAYENLKKTGLDLIKYEDYNEAHYRFSRVNYSNYIYTL